MSNESAVSPKAESIDRIAQLVSDRYPKGTQDPYGKALRHELHKLGRLNDPDITGVNETLRALARFIFDVADIPAYDFTSDGVGITGKEVDAEARLKLADLIFTILYSETPGFLVSGSLSGARPKGYEDRKRSLTTWSFGKWCRTGR